MRAPRIVSTPQAAVGPFIGDHAHTGSPIAVALPLVLAAFKPTQGSRKRGGTAEPFRARQDRLRPRALLRIARVLADTPYAVTAPSKRRPPVVDRLAARLLRRREALGVHVADVHGVALQRVTALVLGGVDRLVVRLPRRREVLPAPAGISKSSTPKR